MSFMPLIASAPLCSAARRQCRRAAVARSILGLVTAALIAACSSGSSGNGGSGGGSGWTPGSFLPSQSFAAQCALPRSGEDYPDVQGSTQAENNWLRSWSHELYLWYDEIEDRDPARHSTAEYFDLMKTFETTPSGTAKDRFHYTIPSEEWAALSQSGVSAGYGASWAIVANRPPREIVVAYVQPNSPAEAAGLARGARVIGVDGVDAINGEGPGVASVLNAALFPDGEGQVHELEILDAGASASRIVSLESTVVTMMPVRHVDVLEVAGRRVGYLLFNEHIATAEAALVEAVDWLRQQQVHELVLDVRYNGGGYLAIASQLAYMVAGEAATAGRVFERMTFNDKHPSTNPVTGAPLTPLPFANRTIGLSDTIPAGTPLPSLDLPRVVVLTGGNTCSASESVINGLRGVGVEVVQIGAATCGKPYGFYPTDNCGTTYFSIQFRGENEAGFGDYGDGFAPADAPIAGGERLPGCWVPDDFERPLGDPEERRLAAALQYLDSETCAEAIIGSSSGLAGKPSAAPLSLPAEPWVPKGAWLENRIVDPQWDWSP